MASPKSNAAEADAVPVQNEDPPLNELEPQESVAIERPRAKSALSEGDMSGLGMETPVASPSERKADERKSGKQDKKERKSKQQQGQGGGIKLVRKED